MSHASILKTVLRNKPLSGHRTRLNTNIQTKLSSRVWGKQLLKDFRRFHTSLEKSSNRNNLSNQLFTNNILNNSNNYLQYILLAIFGSILLLDEHHAEDSPSCSEALEQLHLTLSQRKDQIIPLELLEEVQDYDAEKLEYELDDDGDEDIEDDIDEDDDDDDTIEEEYRRREGSDGSFVPARKEPSSPHYGFSSIEYPYLDRMDKRQYIEEKFMLQIELLKMQRWVKETGAKIVVLVEGRDAAGKGGTIKRLTENLNPRGARVVALDKPTDDEKTQWYFQRYVRHLPHGGEILFFDRSWFNRAGVELVMGFCTFPQYLEFMRSVPYFEEMIVNSGIFLIKFWFSVTKMEQNRRFITRATHSLKQWKLSPMDLESQKRWTQYTTAKEIMFAHTDRPYAPWVIIRSDDKYRARLNAMKVLLLAIPYDQKDEELVSSIDTHIVGSPKRSNRSNGDGEPIFTKSQVELLKKVLNIKGVNIPYKDDTPDALVEEVPQHYWTPEELPPEPPVPRRRRKRSKKELDETRRKRDTSIAGFHSE